MKTYLYRASNLKSTITFLASVSWQKKRQFLAGARNLFQIRVKEIAFSLQPPFCKASYRAVSVQCLNSTQDSKMFMMVRRQ